MFSVILTLLVCGVYTESVNCPENCNCFEILVFDNVNSINRTAMKKFAEGKLSKSVSNQNLNEYKNILISAGVDEVDLKSEVIKKNETVPWNYRQNKKCAKNAKENLRDIFIRNIFMQPFNNQQNNNSKEIRTKRTLKLNLSSGVNTKELGEKINAKRKGLTRNEDKFEESVTVKGSENSKNKKIFIYQITCNRVRDLKSLWFRRLPNPTTELNIRKTYFQSFKAFQQILKESPAQLNQLTVLSISDSVINQKADKKYSTEAALTNKERKPEEKNDGNMHSDFLPFASLQNPQLRSKSEMEVPAKEKCKNLLVLNLVNCTIMHLPQDIFLPFRSLQILNLSNNLIKFIDNEMFSSLINLLQLDIHNNKLQSLNEMMFKNLNKLILLDVSQNLISNVAPSTFQYLTSLNVLNLANNPLSEKEEAMILLGTGKGLQVVDISKTGLKQIPGTLERSVKVLNLMGNHLLSIRCGDLDSYSLLSHLNLRANKISYVEDDALGRLEFLNNLQISENNLFQIPKSLPNNLEILNLSYNNIQNITNLDFLNLSLLKELSISYNQVSNIEGNAFNNLVHLKVLDLSRNPILILPNIYGLVKLTVLNLSYFTNIPGAFSFRYKQFPVQSTESVKHLNLEWSPVLTKIFLQDTKTMESFVNLEELDVRFTNLTTIRKDVFSLLPKIKILRVEGNPWHCGKEILILSTWLKTHVSNRVPSDDDNDDEMNTAHCSTPLRLYKTSLVTLDEKYFEDVSHENGFSHSKTTFARNTEFKNSSKMYSAVSGLKKIISNGKFMNVTNFSMDGNDVEMKKVNGRKYNKSSLNLKTFSWNKTENSKGENCCGKPDDKAGQRSSQNRSTAANLLANRRISTENNSNFTSTTNFDRNKTFIKQYDNFSNFGVKVKNSESPKISEVFLATVKKAEAVTAKDTLALKKEYNSHLSFLILSSIGLTVMAALTFTSLYFSRTRRDQSYQRQNQDIEVCSISNLGNELW